MGESFKEKLKLTPIFFILASPYFAHGAFCAKLNMEWKPQFVHS